MDRGGRSGRGRIIGQSAFSDGVEGKDSRRSSASGGCAQSVMGRDWWEFGASRRIGATEMSARKPDGEAVGGLGDANFHQAEISSVTVSQRLHCGLQLLADMFRDALRGGIERGLERFDIIQVLISPTVDDSVQGILYLVEINDGFHGVESRAGNPDGDSKVMAVERFYSTIPCPATRCGPATRCAEWQPEARGLRKKQFELRSQTRLLRFRAFRLTCQVLLTVSRLPRRLWSSGPPGLPPEGSRWRPGWYRWG